MYDRCPLEAKTPSISTHECRGLKARFTHSARSLAPRQGSSISSSTASTIRRRFDHPFSILGSQRTSAAWIQMARPAWVYSAILVGSSTRRLYPSGEVEFSYVSTVEKRYRRSFTKRGSYKREREERPRAVLVRSVPLALVSWSNGESPASGWTYVSSTPSSVGRWEGRQAMRQEPVAVCRFWVQSFEFAEAL